MTLKQLSNRNRIIFLRKFTQEILLNIYEKERTKQKIKVAKLKQKFLKEKTLPEETFKKIIKTPIFKPIKGLEKREEIKKQKIEKFEKQQEKKKIKKLEELKKESEKLIKTPDIKSQLRTPIYHRVKIPRQIQIRPLIKPTPLQKPEPIKKEIKKPEQELIKIKPEAEPMPKGFSLGKIEKLLQDKTIQSIECPGPEKNILVKRFNKINITKESLSQEEITDLINNFSNQAKIPIIGGILKAAVGNLIISAVISEYVGSRFIINKITPYSLIQ